MLSLLADPVSGGVHDPDAARFDLDVNVLEVPEGSLAGQALQDDPDGSSGFLEYSVDLFEEGDHRTAAAAVLVRFGGIDRGQR
jgi:hypothetical protein